MIYVEPGTLTLYERPSFSSLHPSRSASRAWMNFAAQSFA